MACQAVEKVLEQYSTRMSHYDLSKMSSPERRNTRRQAIKALPLIAAINLFSKSAAAYTFSLDDKIIEVRLQIAPFVILRFCEEYCGRNLREMFISGCELN